MGGKTHGQLYSTFIYCTVAQFNIEDLDGKTIDLSDKAGKPMIVESGSRKKYVLRRDATGVHSTIRPIVRNDIDGSSCIGKAFDGTFTLSEKIVLPTVSAGSPLPVSFLFVAHALFVLTSLYRHRFDRLTYLWSKQISFACTASPWVAPLASIQRVVPLFPADR